MPVAPTAQEFGKGEKMARIGFAGIASAVSLIAWLVAAPPLSAAPVERPERRGEIRFEPDANEQAVVPKSFQLEARTFEFHQKPQPSVSDDVSLSLVTFP